MTFINPRLVRRLVLALLLAPSLAVPVLGCGQDDKSPDRPIVTD